MRQTSNLKVVGSSPTRGKLPSGLTFLAPFRQERVRQKVLTFLAQLVEHVAFNHVVAGSSPAEGIFFGHQMA